MDLATVWFCVIAFFWLGYVFLEGFDFGVGMLVPVLARGEPERRVLLGTIGPVWDGNEVWLIVAAGAMFAAFPAWYAGLFSAFYLPLLVVLLALIGRGVAFEYRGKLPGVWWDRVIVAGSVLPASGIGALLGTLVGGLPIDGAGNRVGPWYGVFGWHSLLGAVGLAGFAAVHGAAFVAVKTDGALRARAGRFVRRYGVCAAAPLVVLAGSVASGPVGWAGVAVAGAAAVVAPVRSARGREGQAFGALAVLVVAVVAVLFGALYPDVLVSTVPGVAPTSVGAAAASPYTLGVLSWVAAFGAPAVLVYQGWTYWVFRRRVGVPR